MSQNLHYDFRLEVDNVLVSWAVTEVPSPNPKDEYGTGTVQVWDAGTYRNLKGSTKKGITISRGPADGHITF